MRSLVLLLALCADLGVVHAALIVNPARPITDRINVNLISVADNNGANSTGGMLGDTTRRVEVFSLVDSIFAQAGVDVSFSYRPGTFNNSFARVGIPGNNDPRPQSDLSAIGSQASAAGGVLSSDRNTINVFLVSIVPGFSQLPQTYAAGLATVGGNGIAYFGGSTLSTFAGGRETLASVLSHEIGHNLGLSHVSTSGNLMQSGGGGERLSATQIATILASRFTVPMPTSPDGDFNGDGQTDGADFLRWQRGAAAGGLSQASLGVWKTTFGAPAGLATVPEPDAILHVGWALWAFCRFRGALSRRTGAWA